MQEVSTPMMKQYMEIKKQYEDCLLLYRMGDFYELFMQDAIVGSKVLDITLTGKSNGKNSRIPMAGVPYHAVDNYLAKLVKAGFKVAICEQVSLPNKYGLVDREVIRIVTPGTVLDEKALEKKENNYIVSITKTNDIVAISTADISTGFFQTTEMKTTDLHQTITDELTRTNPRECILSPELYNDPIVLNILKNISGLNIYCYQEWHTFADKAEEFLKQHFKIGTLAAFGIEEKLLSQQSAAALLGYLQHTQQKTVAHIRTIVSPANDEYMQLDRATVINLELFSTIREHSTKGSLLALLDETITASGGRLLKDWLRKPLIEMTQITSRHDAVEVLLEQPETRFILSENLKHIADIERMLSRLSTGIGNARDLISLRESLTYILTVKAVLAGLRLPFFAQLAASISLDVQVVIDIITTTIKDEPGIDLRNGNLIKPGVHKELDKLRKTVMHSKDWIIDLERTERERTGIGSLKVRYNKVFGFYIEISKANLHLIPDNFIRKQTLVNGERFITPELKAQEEIILTAEERIFAMEYTLFHEVLQTILTSVHTLQIAAQQIAILDCIQTFAVLAERNQYVRPVLVTTGDIDIANGRHPVVETLLPIESRFVPNNVRLDDANKLLIITGPNMAGKSVLIRQTSLICLMNQIGCFVPADKATLSIVDRIFVRSGASDVITSGLSTFMVEMVETAHILHHATKNSLIIMDEIGRGTSTYDGISIAWAVAEYLVTNATGIPKTLFATHYHELQTLEHEYPGVIKNYHMAVIEENNQPVFLHTLQPGGASGSHGIAVAQLAGVPDPVIKRAKEMLKELEKRTLDHQQTYVPDTEFIPKQTNLIEHLIVNELADVDIHQLTPLEALNKLAALKDKLKLLQTTNPEYLEVD
jgi:DNA mismatch repair protein MutS